MKNNKKRIGFIVVLAIILIALVLGYTYSKYTSTSDRSIKTAVAAWAFTGELSNGEDTTTSTSKEISLFADDSEKLAPGTNGTFDIILDATDSDVNVAYTAELASDPTEPTAITYTATNNDTGATATANTLADLFANTNVFSGTVDSGNESTISVVWEWPFSESAAQDEADTAFAETIAENGGSFDFTVNITGTQIQD